MNNKRGQATIFIIIGILIVAGVVLFFMLREDTIESTTEQVTSEIQPVHTYVQNCLSQTTEDILYGVASRGGYYNPIKTSTTEFNIPYYLVNGKISIPSLDEIEEEISKGIEEELKKCIKDFSELNEFKIKESKPKIKTEIRNKSIKIKANYPLKIQKNSEIFEIKDFEIEKKSNLKLFYDSIEKYIQKEKIEEGVCVSCLANISSNYQLDYTSMLLNSQEMEMVYMVKNSTQEINNKTLIYTFAIKH